MTPSATVSKGKRRYNKWAASQTLEDYALRYTADSTRRWSAGTVASTALGATAFLACEALGASITLSYGAMNAVPAVLLSCVVMFLFGLPIAYYAAKEGLDTDLLSRGAGFGYLGSTITSLIYASFTFLLFAVEASIMSAAIVALTGIPFGLAYVICALAVIPIATYGMSAIAKFQTWTQPIWIVLQIAPVIYLLTVDTNVWAEWREFSGLADDADGGWSILYFGIAFSTFLSLLPQIGEQADYLRFLPAQEKIGKRRWWAALLLSGPGWTMIGAAKILLGSVLVVWALTAIDMPATEPVVMFEAVFSGMVGDGKIALIIAAFFVIVCQLKINVTNTYAGSIAWSNFFSRLTHTHPGRVVWLVFNVVLGLVLMQMGILTVIERVLILYAIVASAWIGALAADLSVSKPLGLSPPGIEFKRAHLYDINPVGPVSMVVGIGLALLALSGVLGEVAQAFAPAIALAVAFLLAPLVAWGTKGRYYIARAPSPLPETELVECWICENGFQHQDMAHCPFIEAPICSLCCTLERRCRDRCKDDSRITDQVANLAARTMSPKVAELVRTPLGAFLGIFSVFVAVIAAVLYVVGHEYALAEPQSAPYLSAILPVLLLAFCMLAGVAAWFFVLAEVSRGAAEDETAFHVEMLEKEVAARKVTEVKLEEAKRVAEAADDAKTNYLVSVSHEIRSPLNSIYGYAQLLERGRRVEPREAGKVIMSSAEHLTNMVEGLLDISQVETGTIDVSRDAVALPSLLRQVTDMFRPQAAAKGIGYEFVAEGELPEFVDTDQKRLRQIFINLLSNAVKFTETGHVRLTAKRNGSLTRFEVSDTGIGIAVDDLNRVFEPFQRGKGALVARRQGVGLGLAITEALVRLLGGELKVRSQIGVGTTFTFEIDLPALDHQAPSTSTRAVRISGYEGARKSLLFVDDDPDQLALLERQFRPLGFEVAAVSSGEAALQHLSRAHVDCILMDVMMPGLSGPVTASRIRRIYGARPVIILVSANAHEVPSDKSRPPDCDAFLTKPVDFDALMTQIGRLLDLSWVSEARIHDDGVGELARDLPEGAQHFLPQILEAARMGHLRGVERQLDALAEAVPEAANLVSDLRRRANDFDFRSVIRMIEEMLNVS